jgi:hypothetical protein
MSVTDAMSITEIGEALEQLAEDGFLSNYEEGMVYALVEDAGDQGEKFWESLDEETQEELRKIHRQTVCE